MKMFGKADLNMRFFFQWISKLSSQVVIAI